MKKILTFLAVISISFLMGTGLVQAQENKMFKVTILYPNTPDATFDFDYYLNTHMPLSLKRQGAAVKSVLIEKGYDAGVPGITFAHIVVCHFTYDSQQAFMDAFLPHAEELQGDMGNYTNIQPIIQFSTVEMSQ